MIRSVATMIAPPRAILIAGANGAGKTTFAREVLYVRYPQATFLNADEIQREGGALGHPFAAGRELLRRLDAQVAQGASFAVETTLASQSYVTRLEAWSRAGYRTTLHFIQLPSADFAVERVAHRVAAGGHAVPEADIRMRFDRGIEMFSSIYKPLVDRWYHWRSDDQGLRLDDYSNRR
jgi:predicted ABC-type ATPase